MPKNFARVGGGTSKKARQMRRFKRGQMEVNKVRAGSTAVNDSAPDPSPELGIQKTLSDVGKLLKKRGNPFEVVGKSRPR